MPSAEEKEVHPVLAALEQAVLDLLEEFEEGHGPMEDRDTAALEAAKSHLRQAMDALRQGS